MITKLKRYEKVYAAHADKIYKICLYYLKDQKQAEEATLQVFLNCYKKTDEKDYKHIFGLLVHEAKQIIFGEEVPECLRKEVTQCTTSGER